MAVSRAKKCPQCGEPAAVDASNPYRPFCSERCRNLDLASWLDESYVVSDGFGGAADYGEGSEAAGSKT